MPSKQTANYRLSQWEKSDKVQMEDFNADNAKIDAALKSASDAQAAMQAALNKKGNCSIGFFTYQGTGEHGQSHPTRVTFPRMPSLFIIAALEGILIGRGGQSQAYGCLSANSTTQAQTIPVSWSGTTCSMYDVLYNSGQMNVVGTHLVIAFYAEG